MQFIRKGPDIPEHLLQLHEEGKVVFFCGAGISYPAKLPGFSGLIDGVFANLSEDPNTLEKAAIKLGQYDTAIGLLESRIVGGREAVRREIANILVPIWLYLMQHLRMNHCLSLEEPVQSGYVL